MSSPPPPVPRRPSLKILKKLKTVINNGSEKKTANNKNIETIFINKETPLNKIFKLPEMIFKIFRYLKNSKKKLL